jgi:hypothetical protein
VPPRVGAPQGDRGRSSPCAVPPAGQSPLRTDWTVQGATWLVRVSRGHGTGVEAAAHKVPSQLPRLLERRLDIPGFVEDGDHQRRRRGVPGLIAGATGRGNQPRAVERPPVTRVQRPRRPSADPGEPAIHTESEQLPSPRPAHPQHRPTCRDRMEDRFCELTEVVTGTKQHATHPHPFPDASASPRSGLLATPHSGAVAWSVATTVTGRHRLVARTPETSHHVPDGCPRTRGPRPCTTGDHLAASSAGAGAGFGSTSPTYGPAADPTGKQLWRHAAAWLCILLAPQGTEQGLRWPTRLVGPQRAPPAMSRPSTNARGRMCRLRDDRDLTGEPARS